MQGSNSGQDGKPPRARLTDVARMAGVSLGSASRAVNEPEAVRPATRARVEAAVVALGYIPDARGRALASRRTGTIGVVLPTIANAVYATFVHALQREFATANYALFVLAHEYNPELEARYIARLVGRGVDGLVLVGTDHDPAVEALLGRAGLPQVFAWSVDEAPETGAIGISNARAMAAIAGHLAGLGHRRIAMLNGRNAHNERARMRRAGLAEAAAAQGLELVSIVETPLTLDGGRTGFAQWRALADGATALVCGTDILAAGALDAARTAGVRVPEDLSITGFDDIDLAALLTPALTTVRLPVQQMGEETATALMALLRGEPAPPSRELPTELVVRGSTAGPLRQG